MNWAIVPWNRCRARLEKKEDAEFYGRCELKKGHRGPHALERGFVIVSFTTTVKYLCTGPHLGWCDCSVHNITTPGSAHADDCLANERNW